MSGNVWKALPGCPGGPLECPGVVERLSWLSGSGRDPLSDVREWLGDSLGCPGGSPDHSRTSERVFRPLPDILEGLPTTPRHPGHPSECPGVVGKPSRMFGKPSQSPGVVGSPSRMSGSGQEALLDDREYLGVLPGCPGVFGSPSQMSKSGQRPSRISGSGREACPDFREWSIGPTGCPGVLGRLSRLSGRVSRPLPDIQKGVPTTPGHP